MWQQLMSLLITLCSFINWRLCYSSRPLQEICQALGEHTPPCARLQCVDHNSPVPYTGGTGLLPQDVIEMVLGLKCSSCVAFSPFGAPSQTNALLSFSTVRPSLNSFPHALGTSLLSGVSCEKQLCFGQCLGFELIVIT